MLTIIDRYIARNFILYFFAGLTVFVTIFLAVEFISTMVRFNATGDIILRYYEAYLPLIIYQLLPVGALIGTLFTLSSLNRNNEMIALFSMGMSLARISAPILVLLGLLSVFTFWLGDKIVPTFTKKRNYVYYVELKKKPGLYSTVKTDRIWFRSDNTIFNIQSMNAEKGVAEGITLYYFDSAWELVQLIKAQRVKMQGSVWNLEDGAVTLFAEESSFPLTKPFSRKTLTVSEDLADIRSVNPGSDSLSVAELRRFISRNKEAGVDSLRFEVDYYAKFSFAFAGLILSMLGIPFMVQRARSGGGMVNVGIALAITFSFWIIYSSSLSMGKHGSLHPFLAAWAPNILFGGLAAFLLFRLKR